MLHVTPAFDVARVPVSFPTPHPDALILALAPELEAAASAYLAYDRDMHVTPDDPDHDEAMAHHTALYQALKSVTDRIFIHRPTTLPGVLLTAHAAAVMAPEDWDEKPEHVDEGGVLLRRVCNDLFRLAGVDWRGRPLAGAAPAGDTAAALAADGS